MEAYRHLRGVLRRQAPGQKGGDHAGQDIATAARGHAGISLATDPRGTPARTHDQGPGALEYQGAAKLIPQPAGGAEAVRLHLRRGTAQEARRLPGMGGQDPILPV